MNIKRILVNAIIQGKIVSRKKHWHKINKTRLSATDTLTKEQIKCIKKYWKPFYRQVPLDDFKFYTTRNGVFSPKYIPDSLFSSYVYTHFNDNMKAEQLDDKNFYDLLFHDIQQPKTIARRREGCFLDPSYRKINLEQCVNLCKTWGGVISSSKLLVPLLADRESLFGHPISLWRS